MTKQVPFRYDSTIFFALTDVLFTFLQAFFSDQPAFSKSGFCNFSQIFFLHYYSFLLFVMILVEVGDEDWLSAKNGAQYTLGHRTTEPRTDLEANRAGGFLQKESNLLSPNTNWVAAPHNIGRAGR